MSCPAPEASSPFCWGNATRTEASHWSLEGDQQLTFRRVCPRSVYTVPDMRLVGYTGPATTCCRWPPLSSPPESLFDVRQPKGPRGLPGPRTPNRSQRPQRRDARRRCKVFTRITVPGAGPDDLVSVKARIRAV
ncbi:hypothetical protein CGRA01v4_14913 [Colletotrichum graminicola]|nr:hypothetical protein CGRA01v4_14913 [Colletotrichum graminicola]